MRLRLFRSSLFALGVAIASVAASSGAEAQNYPWCAIYGTGFEGTNCGFASFQQCLTNVSGIGGFCEPNNLYQLPPGPQQSRRVQP
jgi:hypothetical protein